METENGGTHRNDWFFKKGTCEKQNPWVPPNFAGFWDIGTVQCSLKPQNVIFFTTIHYHPLPSISWRSKRNPPAVVRDRSEWIRYPYESSMNYGKSITIP